MKQDPVHRLVGVLGTMVLCVALYGVYVAVEAGDAMNAAPTSATPISQQQPAEPAAPRG
jgi:hypothetical protein